MTHKNIRDKSISFIMIHILLFILAFPISGARHVVNSTLKDNSLEGSFPFFLSNASDGDTIVFNIPDSSTIQVNGMLRITADLMIDGRNEATGDRIVLKSASLFIGGCQTRISNFIFREFTGTSTERYCAIRDSGATTVVWLDSVEIEGRFFMTTTYLYALPFKTIRVL